MKTQAILLLFMVCCVNLREISGKKYRKSEITEKAIKRDENIMDVSDFSIYYDLYTNETIKKMLPRPWYKPGWMLRLPFQGGPCDCVDTQCSCCSGIRIPAVNFDRQTCIKLDFKPEEAIFDMEVTMNNNSIFKSEYSLTNPPPLCIPVIIPYLPPGFIDYCIRLFEISLADRMLHACVDVDTRIDRAPVLILHFDCINLSLSNGISITKPGGGGAGTETSEEPNQGEQTQVDSDVYDPVTEMSSSVTENIFNNSIKYI